MELIDRQRLLAEARKLNSTITGRDKPFPVTDAFMEVISRQPPVQPEISDEQAIEHLQESGWMQNHDKQMYEMGLREQLADDSDSYDALLPSAQPELIEKAAYIRGFEQGRTQGMIDSQGGKK